MQLYILEATHTLPAAVSIPYKAGYGTVYLLWCAATVSSPSKEFAVRILEFLNSIVGKHMAIIVLYIAAMALLAPWTLIWIKTSWITSLLMVVMFGMGLTLQPQDFAVVLKNPGDILLGCTAQFTIMPLLGFGLGTLFGLDDALMVGVILVGTCPGGTASNVITYLSRGDVALSVGMTSVSTLLAPVLTPALTYLFLNHTISINMTAMFLSIVQVVVLPILIGFLVNRYCAALARNVVKAVPLVSVTAIVMIVAAVVAANAPKILNSGGVILCVVIAHNLLGYVFGYGIARLRNLPLAKKKAIAIEVGMQNSGLATSLAATSFPLLAMATVPGAIFSIWHNISGAILANFFTGMHENEHK